MKPTFLFIGPDKTGSTWLYEILLRHPLCYVPPVKDIYFFDRYYDRGLTWYWSFFAEAPPDARAAGEFSHDYLFSGLAAERIARDLPDVKLLTTLRDPAERVFSHYLHLIRSGRTRASFEEALEKFPELVENSLYYRHLRAYLDRFDRERLLVLFFEDLRSDPRSFAATVFSFLGLAPRPDIDYNARFMVASRPRSFAAAHAAKRGAETARRLGLARLVGRVKRGWLARLLYVPYRDDERPRLDPAMRHRLVARFRPDVERLEAVLHKDLSRWKTTGTALGEAVRSEK